MTSLRACRGLQLKYARMNTVATPRMAVTMGIPQRGCRPLCRSVLLPFRKRLKNRSDDSDSWRRRVRHAVCCSVG